MVERYVALAYDNGVILRQICLKHCVAWLRRVNGEKSQACGALTCPAIGRSSASAPGAEFGPAKRCAYHLCCAGEKT